MHEQGGLARRRRALVRRTRDADDDAPALEPVEHVARRERAGLGVELVTRLDQPRRRGRVEVGAERDHQDVRVEGAGGGLDPARVRVDRHHVRLHETHAGLRDVGVRMVDLGGRPAAEHHVELGEAEHEAVGPVDEYDVDVVAELLGQGG